MGAGGGRLQGGTGQGGERSTDGTSVCPSLTGPQEQWCAILVDEAVASRCRPGPLAAGHRHRDCSTC